MPRLTPFLLLLSLAAAAQPRPIPKEELPVRPDSKFSLTVYSSADPASFDPRQTGDDRTPVPGYAVVRETRKITLAAGDNQVKFTDVASQIDPTTVSFKSLTAPASTAVLEQSYEYDLLSPDALLQKYVGRNVIINRKQEPIAGDRTRMPETIEAKLLSFTPDQFVLQSNNKQLPVQIIPRNADITEVKLFDLQTGLITKPTLVWRLTTDRAGEHDALVSYQTGGITWRADYSLVVNKDDTAADLSAWVTVVNQSGAGYPNVKLKLVAGDVQRVRAERPTWRDAGGTVAPEAVKERAFFEYHLYTLPRATSLANYSTKQLELIPAKPNLPVAKAYVYVGRRTAIPYGDRPYAERDVDDADNKKVDVQLRLKNSANAGLGIPLPAGRVRVYKRDDQDPDDPAGSLEFVGEDTIDHTPKDEELMFRVGSAFDLVGEHVATNFTYDQARKTMTESFEVKLRNHKKEPVTIVVKEPLFRYHTWEVTAASEKFTKHDARTIHFDVAVPPGQEKVVTYTVKYTW